MARGSIFLPGANGIGRGFYRPGPNQIGGSLGGLGRAGTASYIGQVATASMPPNTFINLGANHWVMSRSRHIMRDSAPTIAIVIPTWYLKHGFLTETNFGGTATVTASIEYPVGTFTQITWSGSSSAVLADGASTLSDFVAAPPKGAVFFVRMWWNAAAGFLYNSPGGNGSPVANQSGRDNNNGEAFAFATSSLPDQTMGGTITSQESQGANGWRPAAIVGRTTLPSFGLIGDSRGRGQADAYTDATTNIGQIARSVGPSYAYINVAFSGELASTFIGNSSKRVALVNAYCSHTINAMGINDLLGSQTAAALTTSNQSILALFPTKKNYLATLAPDSSSTDAWFTTGNQTTASLNAARVTYNGSVRSGAVGGLGFLEIATVAEGTQDSGKWIVSTITGQYTASNAAKVMTVTAITSGVIAVGDFIGGVGVTGGQQVISLGTGAGGIGTYNDSLTQTVASETMFSNPATIDGLHETPAMNQLYNTSGVFNPANYHYP